MIQHVIDRHDPVGEQWIAGQRQRQGKDHAGLTSRHVQKIRTCGAAPSAHCCLQLMHSICQYSGDTEGDWCCRALISCFFDLKNAYVLRRAASPIAKRGILQQFFSNASRGRF
jgi:hypothetical protein